MITIHPHYVLLSKSFLMFSIVIYLLLFMRTRCDTSDKNLALFCFQNCTVSRCQAQHGWMLQWSSANKNKCSRKIGEKRVDFAPLFRIKLCFPSFLLDKVSQPIPYKGHRRWGKTNSGGHGSFLQMKALNFSIVQLIQIILKEKYFCKLVSRLRRLWGPEIKYAQVRQKMKGLYVGQWVEMTWNYSQPSVRELFANEMIQSTRNIDKISMETRLKTRENKEL